MFIIVCLKGFLFIGEINYMTDEIVVIPIYEPTT